MKKIIWIWFILAAFPLFSQENAVIRNGRSVNGVSRQKTPNPWRVGGGMGLSFGDHNYFAVRVSPFLGYRITRDVEAGLSVGYQFSKRHSYKQHLFNFGPFLNYYPIENVFIRVHYEYYTGNNKHKTRKSTYSFDENALWLGAGYRSSGPVQFYAGLMYDVLYKNDSNVFTNGLRPIFGVSFVL